MADELPEDQRLKDISPKAYEHPADRAATAALQQIPMMDTVVRKLIEFGRAVDPAAAARRRGPARRRTSCRRSGRRTGRRWRGWTSTQVPDLYMWQMPFTNAMAIGSKKPMVVLNSRHGQPDGRARAAHRARPRGRPHPLRPHALPDGAVDPAADRRRPAAAAAVLRRAAAAGDPARAARVVPRRGAHAATARRRSSTAAR